MDAFTYPTQPHVRRHGPQGYTSIPVYNDFRVQWRRMIGLAKEYDPELYRKLMGYPDDLPDLTRLLPPQGNTRPEGVTTSFYALRSRGELPDTY